MPCAQLENPPLRGVVRHRAHTAACVWAVGPFRLHVWRRRRRPGQRYESKLDRHGGARCGLDTSPHRQDESPYPSGVVVDLSRGRTLNEARERVLQLNTLGVSAWMTDQLPQHSYNRLSAILSHRCASAPRSTRPIWSGPPGGGALPPGVRQHPLARRVLRDRGAAASPWRDRDLAGGPELQQRAVPPAGRVRRLRRHWVGAARDVIALQPSRRWSTATALLQARQAAHLRQRAGPHQAQPVETVRQPQHALGRGDDRPAGTRTCSSSARGSRPPTSTTDVTRLPAGPPRSAAPRARVFSSTGRSASSGRPPDRIGPQSAPCCASPRRRYAR